MDQKRLFEKNLNRVKFFLKLIGLGIDKDDRQRSFFQRLCRRRIFFMHFIQLNLNLIGEVAWMMNGFTFGVGTMEEYTHLLPGLTLGILGDLKTFYMIGYAHYVLDLMESFKSQYTNMILTNETQKDILKKKLSFLLTTNRTLGLPYVFGVSMFAIGPIIVMMSIYFTKGKVELILPFIELYPFDPFKFPIFPIIYVYQIWSETAAVMFVYGPDCFYYTACMFIHIHFDHLQHDVEEFIEKYPNNHTNHHQSYYSEFAELVNRHQELIRCVTLLEIIYSKSTLFNFVSSSLIICVTGFNIMAIKDLPLAVAFTCFFVVGFVQISAYCYYGELLIQSSSKVADAIYNSKWYECSIANMKDYLFILTRAQKPCQLTAYGFSVISLNSFATILSTSWSYFALLLTLYKEPQTSQH